MDDNLRNLVVEFCQKCPTCIKNTKICTHNPIEFQQLEIYYYAMKKCEKVILSLSVLEDDHSLKDAFLQIQ